MSWFAMIFGLIPVNPTCALSPPSFSRPGECAGAVRSRRYPGRPRSSNSWRGTSESRPCARATSRQRPDSRPAAARARRKDATARSRRRRRRVFFRKLVGRTVVAVARQDPAQPEPELLAEARGDQAGELGNEIPDRFAKSSCAGCRDEAAEISDVERAVPCAESRRPSVLIPENVGNVNRGS